MSTASQKSSIYWLKVLIFFILLLGFQALPAPAPLTPFGMKVVGVFFAMLFGWSTIGLIWPSIAGMLAIVLFGVLPMGEFLASGWGSPITMLVFFMMMVAKNLEKGGISSFIATWFISRSVVIGRPWLFCFMFLFSVSVVASLTSAVATIFLGWAIFSDILEEIHAEKFEPFANFINIGIVMASCAGDAIFHFRTVGAVAFGVMTKISGMDLNTVNYFFWALTASMALATLYSLGGKFLFRIDAGKLKKLDKAYFATKDLSLDTRQKLLLAHMLVLILLMLLPSFTPEGWILNQMISKIGAVGIAATICLMMCIVRVAGRPLMDPAACVRDGVSFEVMFLMATIFPIALKLFPMKETGINAFLVGILEPLVTGYPPIIFVMVAAFAALVLTNVMGNVTVPTLIYPVFYPIALTLGISPVALMVPIAFASTFGVMLPCGCPMAAVMFGNKEAIRIKDIMRYVPFWFSLSALVVCVLWAMLAQVLF